MIHQPQPAQVVGKLTGKETHLAPDTFLHRPAFTGQPLSHKQEKAPVRLGVTDKNGHRFLNQFIRLRNVGPGLSHHPAQHQSQLIHELKPQIVHIAEMPVKRGWNHTRLTGYFPDTKTGEMPPLANQR